MTGSFTCAIVVRLLAAKVMPTTADSIAVALRKRKEEIGASYDRELSGIQDSIDATKVERAKAKASAVEARIEEETAPLTRQNQELEAQIEETYNENKVPGLCRNHTVVAMFFPGSLKDWIIDGIAAAVLLFLIPLFIVLGLSAHPVALSLVLFCYFVVVFGLYLYILHRFMFRNISVNEEVEALRTTIRGNNKSKQAISSRIKRNQDESEYHLESFDEEIGRFQTQMEETVSRRQAALDQFENETRHQMTAELTEAGKAQAEELAQRLESARKAQANLDNEISTLETAIAEEYEPVLGKDLMHKGKMEALVAFCEEHPDLSIEAAVAQYRAKR